MNKNNSMLEKEELEEEEVDDWRNFPIHPKRTLTKGQVSFLVDIVQYYAQTTKKSTQKILQMVNEKFSFPKEDRTMMIHNLPMDSDEYDTIHLVKRYTNISPIGIYKRNQIGAVLFRTVEDFESAFKILNKGKRMVWNNTISVTKFNKPSSEFLFVPSYSVYKMRKLEKLNLWWNTKYDEESSEQDRKSVV